MAEETVIGQTPVQTPTEVQATVTTTPATPQVTETVEQLRERAIVLERERDENAQKLLAANRAVEAGRKFEKFEEFQTDVMTKLSEIPTLKNEISTLRQENNDMKTILSGKAAVTPSTTAVPAQITPQATPTADVERVNNMFGTTIK